MLAEERRERLTPAPRLLPLPSLLLGGLGLAVGLAAGLGLRRRLPCLRAGLGDLALRRGGSRLRGGLAATTQVVVAERAAVGAEDRGLDLAEDAHGSDP